MQAGGLEPGINLFRIDAHNATGGIAALPWIRQAFIKKSWPSTIVITVKEQRPLALVNVENGQTSELFYLNNNGSLFSSVNLGQDFDFPVITGNEVTRLKVDDRLPEGGLAHSALKLLRLAAKGNAILPIQSISEVHLDEDEGLVVYLVDQPFPIYFGTDDLYKKYYRLVKILERMYRKKEMEGITDIRMDYLDNKVLVARTEIDR